MTNFDYLRARLLTRAGISLCDESFTEILQRVHRHSAPFIQLMKNRLHMGHLRYGPLAGESKPHYNHIKAIRERLDKWELDGNDEHLVDVANLCLVEFVEGAHPKKHFTASDSGGGVQIK